MTAGAVLSEKKGTTEEVGLSIYGTLSAGYGTLCVGYATLLVGYGRYPMTLAIGNPFALWVGYPLALSVAKLLGSKRLILIPPAAYSASRRRRESRLGVGGAAKSIWFPVPRHCDMAW